MKINLPMSLLEKELKIMHQELDGNNYPKGSLEIDVALMNLAAKGHLKATINIDRHMSVELWG